MDKHERYKQIEENWLYLHIHLERPRIKSGTFDVSKKIMVKEKKVRVFEYGRVIDNFHIDAFFFY